MGDAVEYPGELLDGVGDVLCVGAEFGLPGAGLFQYEVVPVEFTCQPPLVGYAANAVDVLGLDPENIEMC